MNTIEFTDRLIDKTNILYGSISALLTMILGDYWFLFATFMLLNVVDYFTGWAKAKYYNKENSVKGAKGILKKVGYWVVIAISFLVAFLFNKFGTYFNIDLGFTIFIGWLTLASYIINEIRSILENLTQMKVNIPKWLLKGLEVAEHTVTNITDNIDKDEGVNKNE